MTETSTSPDVIEVRGLTKRYRAHVAVSDVSFSVRRGEIFGIAGPNGAGKTTTVECIAGLRRADAGTIRVFGLDPVGDASALHQVVGVQLQQSALHEKMRVGEALKLYRSFYRKPADADGLIDAVGLRDKRGTAYEKLSGGQKQRLSIALALIGDPKVAILDELTTGLDPHARREVWSLVERVRDRGVTVVLVSHDMHEAQRLCDRVAFIDGGRLVAVDSPSAMIARAGSSSASLEDAFIALTSAAGTQSLAR